MNSIHSMSKTFCLQFAVPLLILGLSVAVTTPSSASADPAGSIGTATVGTATVVIELPGEAEFSWSEQDTRSLVFFASRLDRGGIRLAPRKEVLPSRARREGRELFVDVELESSLWRLDCTAPALFVPSTLVDLREKDHDVMRVAAEPGSQVEGVIALADQPELKAAFATLEAKVSVATQPEGLVLVAEDSRVDGYCGVDRTESKLICPVPAGQFDVKVELPGFMPLYFWATDVEAGEPEDLGRFEFQKGASFVGWVLPPDLAPVELQQVDLRLEPVLGDGLQDGQGGIGRPGDGDRFKLLTMSTHPSAEGFFRFSGLEEGIYRLVASGYSTQKDLESSVSPVTILPNLETRLTTPLELQRPGTLTVYVDPPVQPDGEPWVIVLLDKGGRHHDDGPTVSHVDYSGVWFAEGVHPGAYTLVLQTSEGPDRKRWAVRDIEVDGDLIESVDLPVVEVRGELRRGSKVLAGSIWFGGRFGPESVLMEADEEGRFRGFLPHAGEWDVDVRREGQHSTQNLEPVVIDPPQGGYAELEVELPWTNIPGRVVNEEGRPVENANVFAVRDVGREFIGQTLSSQGGEFEFSGLETGRVWIGSSGPDGEAEPVEIDLREGLRTEVLELMLERPAARTITLQTDAGPVAGARVWYLPTGPGPRLVKEGRTDPDGKLQLLVPTSIDSVDLEILPGSLAMRVLRIEFGEEREQVISLNPWGSFLQLDGGGRPINHLAMFKDGVLVPRMNVLLHWIRETTGQGVDFEQVGSFEIPRADWGTYVLCAADEIDGSQLELAAAGGTPEGCASGYLAPGGTLSLNLES